MTNIKNRDCVAIHLQIDSFSAEMIDKLLTLFNNEFDKHIYKYEIIDFLVYEFKRFTGDFDDSQVIMEFLKFKDLDQYAGDYDDTENEI